MIDDTEGRAFFYKPAQAFIEQNGGKLDEDNEEHKRDGDREPLCERAAKHHGRRRSFADGLDGGERTRNDPTPKEGDLHPFQRRLDVCARNFRRKGS